MRRGELSQRTDVLLVKPQLAIARLRLHASMMSICLSVCLSVCRQNAKKRNFLKN